MRQYHTNITIDTWMRSLVDQLLTLSHTNGYVEISRSIIAPREPKHSRKADIWKEIELQLDMGADSVAAEMKLAPQNYLRWTLRSKKKNTS